MINTKGKQENLTIKDYIFLWSGIILCGGFFILWIFGTFDRPICRRGITFKAKSVAFDQHDLTVLGGDFDRLRPISGQSVHC